MRALRLVCSLLCTTLAAEAWAQKVVVLELTGDRRGAIRRQVEQALTATGEVEAVPVSAWNGAAREKELSSRALTSLQTIRTLAPALGVDAVVTGVVGRRLSLRIYDAAGEQVSAQNVPLASGRLSQANARRLAAAIAAATPRPAPAETAPPEEAPPAVEAEIPEAVETLPEVDLAPAVGASAAAVASSAPGPKLFLFEVTGTTTWRSHCARPTVRSCREYDDLEDGTEPPGETQTFTSSAPYLGYLLSAELFPLGGFEAWWRGFGVTGTFGQAFAQTRVRISNPSGGSPQETVNAVDTTWSVHAAYRWFFPFGEEGLAGYAGGHVGFRGHAFVVDPGSSTLLASSVRRFPTVGLDARLPLAKWAQGELSVGYLIAPSPSPGITDRYGADVSSHGFRAAAALTGELWGPLGYALRFSWERYGDAFTGAGTHWFDGGTAEETYSAIFFGVSAGF